MTDTPERPEPKLTVEAGPWGGPVYRYRGAEIRCDKGGQVCGLFMEGFCCKARRPMILR
jgi:hypothetical protein